MKILITGDKGFIASNLKKYFEDNYGSGIEIFGFDEEDYNSGRYLNLCRHDFKYVFHLAAIARTVDCTEDPFWRSFNSNIALTNWVLNLNFDKIIYASSCALYGDQTTFPITEANLPNPPSIYAAQKFYSENLIHFHCKNKNKTSACLRFFNVYGPGQSQKGSYPNVLASMIKTFKEKKYVEVTGNGNQTRDFVFVDDVIQAIVQSMLFSNTNKIYNVSSGVETSINQLASYITNDIRYIPERDFDIKKQVASYDKIKNELGWSPEISLEEGIKRTLEVELRK